jgi:branched-chain amino acid transport system permease protein
MEYLLHILVMMGIYTVLAISLDLIAGQTGLLSIAQAAFYGLGAYTSGLLAVSFGVPFFWGTIAAMALAGVISLVVSLPSLRLRDEYFMIATFGFQMITVSIMNNWLSLTGGPLGIRNIPPPTIIGWTIHSQLGFAVLAVSLAAFTILVVSLLTNSPFGRVLRAIREDEVFAQSFGKNTLWFKAASFAISAALAASAGSLYAHYVSYIDPTSFTMMESILIIAMVLIGGAGSSLGPVIGAIILVGLPEALRFVGLPAAVAANLRQIFYGMLLVTLMWIRPRGLVGRYGLGR